MKKDYKASGRTGRRGTALGARTRSSLLKVYRVKSGYDCGRGSTGDRCKTARGGEKAQRPATGATRSASVLAGKRAALKTSGGEKLCLWDGPARSGGPLCAALP